MFGIGFFEFLIIVFGILLFVKPEDLPRFIYRIRKGYHSLQKTYSSFVREINVLSHNVESNILQEDQRKRETKEGVAEQQQIKKEKLSLPKQKRTKGVVYKGRQKKNHNTSKST